MNTAIFQVMVSFLIKLWTLQWAVVCLQYKIIYLLSILRKNFRHPLYIFITCTWSWFVHDVFVNFPSTVDVIDSFHISNSSTESINFKVEWETENQLPFLDTWGLMIPWNSRSTENKLIQIVKLMLNLVIQTM